MKGQITLQEWIKPDTIPHCEHFVKHTGQQVKECLKANVSVFQDGYIQCYRELEEKIEREEK